MADSQFHFGVHRLRTLAGHQIYIFDLERAVVQVVVLLTNVSSVLKYLHRICTHSNVGTQRSLPGRNLPNMKVMDVFYVSYRLQIGNNGHHINVSWSSFHQNSQALLNDIRYCEATDHSKQDCADRVGIRP